MDITNMPPSPELDALMAKQVMGWELKQVFLSDAYITAWDAGNGYYRPVWSWSPSTDIACAFEVVEKMQAEPDEWFFQIARTTVISPNWYAEFGGKMVRAETAPLAICRAALAALDKGE
jgi:hypothetical protein